MTGADVLIFLVLLGSTAIGLLRGFVREASSLVFWIIAIWAAWKFGGVVEPHLGGLLADPNVAPWVGRLVILVLVLLVGWVVGLLMGYFTRSLGLGAMDRVIGVLFGIVRGMVLVGLMIIGGELLHLNHEEWWNRSKLGPSSSAKPTSKSDPRGAEVLDVRNHRNGGCERGESTHL